MTRRAVIALAVWAAVMVAAIAIATTGQHTRPIVDTPPTTTNSHSGETISHASRNRSSRALHIERPHTGQPMKGSTDVRSE